MMRLPVEFSTDVTLGCYNKRLPVAPRRNIQGPFGALASISRKVPVELRKEGNLMIHVVVFWFMTPYRLVMTFGLKCRTRIGLWNVRTLVHSGKLKTVCREMENYKLDIVGMSEVRWDSFGEIATQNEFTVLYSEYNADEGPVRRDGVALLHSKIAKRSRIEWHPVSVKNFNSAFERECTRCNSYPVLCTNFVV
jgi:hypothetical protein